MIDDKNNLRLFLLRVKDAREVLQLLEKELQEFLLLEEFPETKKVLELVKED